MAETLNYYEINCSWGSHDWILGALFFLLFIMTYLYSNLMKI